MQRFLSLICFYFLMSVSSIAQDTAQVLPDSAYHSFILNHKPLTAAELNTFKFEKGYQSIYGDYVSAYLKEQDSYAITKNAIGKKYGMVCFGAS